MRRMSTPTKRRPRLGAFESSPPVAIGGSHPATKWTAPNTVGARIRAQRVAAGLSICVLAERMGVSQPTLTRWEHNQVEMTLRRLQLVADTLGIDPRILLGDKVARR